MHARVYVCILNAKEKQFRIRRTQQLMDGLEHIIEDLPTVQKYCNRVHID